MRLVPVPAFADNYIWLLVDDAARALIVDPGDAAPVLEALARESLEPTAILLTHHHPDHVGGVARLLQVHPALPVLAPDDARITTATRRVGDGDEVVIDAPSATFQVVAVPGHTSSHVAFAGAGVLFAGDTLFSVGCGRLFEGTPAQMLASLDRLAALPGDLQLCCGHEYTLANCAFALSVDPDNAALRERDAQARAARARGEPTLPSALSQERATNPFLRCDAPSIRAASTRALGEAVAADRVERFAWLRRHKDQFRA